MCQKCTSHLKVASQPLFHRLKDNSVARGTPLGGRLLVVPRGLSFLFSLLIYDIYILDSPGEVESCDIPFTSTPIENGFICLVSKSGKTEQ
ncbi:hypothetical protein TNCV_1989001 [Trichonephila clavipes]|nr:hypothetical protein TNCV_1989001 [Trichonephila clavipes]